MIGDRDSAIGHHDAAVSNVDMITNQKFPLIIMEERIGSAQHPSGEPRPGGDDAVLINVNVISDTDPFRRINQYADVYGD